MNDFSELEADLKKLRPVAASADLARRIACALEQTEKTSTAGLLPRPTQTAKVWWSFSLAFTGIAALLVIGFTFFDRPATAPAVGSGNPPPADRGFQPAGLTQVVYSGRDEGLVLSPNDSGTLRRRLRYETRETMRWSNAQTGASVRVSYPVEQVVLTPVSFQ
jgi:hypothetical protein